LAACPDSAIFVPAQVKQVHGSHPVHIDRPLPQRSDFSPSTALPQASLSARQMRNLLLLFLLVLEVLCLREHAHRKCDGQRIVNEESCTAILDELLLQL